MKKEVLSKVGTDYMGNDVYEIKVNNVLSVCDLDDERLHFSYNSDKGLLFIIGGSVSDQIIVLFN